MDFSSSSKLLESCTSHFYFISTFKGVRFLPKRCLMTLTLKPPPLHSPLFSLSVVHLRVRPGPDSLRPQLRRPQPANRFVRGPDSTARRRPPACCQCVRQRAEPQRTGLPPVSTLTATSGHGRCVKLKNKNNNKKKKKSGKCLFSLKKAKLEFWIVLWECWMHTVCETETFVKAGIQ